MHFSLFSFAIGKVWGFNFFNINWTEDEEDPGHALLGFYKAEKEIAIEILGLTISIIGEANE